MSADDSPCIFLIFHLIPTFVVLLQIFQSSCMVIHLSATYEIIKSKPLGYKHANPTCAEPFGNFSSSVKVTLTVSRYICCLCHFVRFFSVLLTLFCWVD